MNAEEIKAVPWLYGLGITADGCCWSNLNNRHGFGTWKPRAKRHGFGGYFVIDTLTADMKRRACYVHDLVAAMFIGERPAGHLVNHKDGDKLNNSVANLEYTTPSGNMRHAYRTGLRKTKLSPQQVAEIRSTYRRGCPDNNMHRLSIRFGVCQATIREILSGEIWR
jgi:hypothetical protein